MPHTSEERDHLSVPLCGARKKNGELCRAFAGQGTTHLGYGKCKYHSGSTPNGRQSAALEKARSGRIRNPVTPFEVTPAQLMNGVVQLTAGNLMWLADVMKDITDVDTPEYQGLVKFLADTRKDAAQIAKMAADMGLTDRLSALNADAATQIAHLFGLVAEDINLSPAQKKALGPALRRHLTEMQGGDVNGAAELAEETTT